MQFEDKANDAQGITTSTTFPVTMTVRATKEIKHAQSTEATTAKTTTLAPTKTLIPMTVATSTKSKPKQSKATTSQSRQATTTSLYANETLPDGYLVYSPDCHIRALDPFAEDVMELYNKEDTVLCQLSEPITKIQYNWSKLTADLVLNTELGASGAYADITCCYQEINRSGEDEDADDEFR